MAELVHAQLLERPGRPLRAAALPRSPLGEHEIRIAVDACGGYAEETVADERFCFRLPDDRDAAELAPLLCAGLIGFRSLRFAGDAERLGLYGFGAAAHIVSQVARAEGRRVFALTRRGDYDA